MNIVDYKTGKARSQEDADESLQLSIYAMAASQKWGYRVGTLMFHNLEGNVPVISKRTDFHLEQARERVLNVARGIASGNFKPKPDFYCNFCAFRGLCPAKEKQVPNLGHDNQPTSLRSETIVCKNFRAKNLGDAFGVPFYFFTHLLNASFSSLPFSWLPLFSILPFHFSWKNLQRSFCCNYMKYTVIEK